MEVRFVTRNVELPADVKDYMVKKVSKIEKFFDRILGTQIALNFKRRMNVVEITSNVNGVVMRGEEYAPDLRKAFDKALKNIELAMNGADDGEDSLFKVGQSEQEDAEAISEEDAEEVMA